MPAYDGGGYDGTYNLFIAGIPLFVSFFYPGRSCDTDWSQDGTLFGAYLSYLYPGRDYIRNAQGMRGCLYPYADYLFWSLYLEDSMDSDYRSHAADIGDGHVKLPHYMGSDIHSFPALLQKRKLAEAVKNTVQVS